jgi:hypothetical protein
MPLMEDDHVVQTLPADTPRGDQDFFDPHVPHALLKGRSINAVPSAKQVSRDVVPGKCFQYLLGSPLCRGMLGGVCARDYRLNQSRIGDECRTLLTPLCPVIASKRINLTMPLGPMPVARHERSYYAPKCLDTIVGVGLLST